MGTYLHFTSKKIWVRKYRIQKFKGIHLHGKNCLIHLKKTSYNCKSCGCSFEIEFDYIAKCHIMTNRLVFCIVVEFDEVYSISSIVDRYNVSYNSVPRILNYLRVSITRFSNVFCIDEFKGDSGNIKYQTSRLNGDKHSFIDTLPTMDKKFLFNYLKKIPN